MELTTALIFPVIVMLAGLVLEYWVIQPLRKSSAISRKPKTGQQNTRVIASQPLFLRSSFSRISSVLLFLVFTIIYFLNVYPFYQEYYQSFFYQVLEYRYTETISWGNSINENYAIKIPKYIRSGQETRIDFQIENKTDKTLESIELRASTRYTRYSRDIPFTVESTPIETIFRNVPPQSKEWKTINYAPPENLLDGDRVELIFYRNDKKLDYVTYATSTIYVDRINALFIWLFDNILLTYWAYLLLFIIVVVASMVAIFEYQPPNETFKSRNGLFYFFRILIRASAIILLVIGFSAWSLSYYSQWYANLSFLFAIATYLPFQTLFKRIQPQINMLRSRIKNRNKTLGKP